MTNTMKVVTQEMIHNATQIERCGLMREIVRGAKFSPETRTTEERLDEVAKRMTKPQARFARL